MKKLAILCVAFIFAALFTVSASAQNTGNDAPKKEEPKKEEPKKEEKSPLLTDWDVVISAQGQEIPGTFKLEKDGDNYKGAVITAVAEVPLKNIKIKDDNTFTADVTVNVQGQTFEGTMTGKLDGDKISGELNLSGLGAIPYSGKKAEKK